jgi:hypothetical protein
MRAAMTDDLRKRVNDTGISEEQFLRIAYSLTYAALALATLLYQGGMTIYYARRRSAVRTALEEVTFE